MEKLLDIDEVTEILGVTRATIYSWTSRNKIPHIKLSKRLLKFREKELMDWIDRRAINADAGKEEKTKIRRTRPSLSLHDDHLERIIRSAKEEALPCG